MKELLKKRSTWWIIAYGLMVLGGLVFVWLNEIVGQPEMLKYPVTALVAVSSMAIGLILSAVLLAFAPKRKGR